MRSCYVSIPFGIKSDLDGRSLDFDHLYRAVIQPAVQELDMECRRLDEYSPGAIWHKTMFTALISSDLMIADLSTHNANVLYELGVRHALKRGRTLLISARGRLPGNLGYAQALWYEPDEFGRLSGEPAARFREALQANIRQSQRSTVSDSPLYAFFPDIQVLLPPELESGRPARRAPATRARRGFVQSVLESPARAKGDLRRSEAEVRSSTEADPVEYLNLLRKYRDLSDWDHVIALAGDAPPAVASSPEVQQLLALALNRRGTPGDRDRAIALMEQLVAETGGDGETFGILGRIYKDRYERAKLDGDDKAAADDLARALHYYRAGFEKNPKDYYSGINVVTLLLQQAGNAARADLDYIVPRVRAAVREKREDGPLDFWELAADLQLAVVARDWPAAIEASRLVAAQASSAWMLESSLRDLTAVGRQLSDPDERHQFDQILAVLRPVDSALETAE